MKNLWMNCSRCPFSCTVQKVLQKSLREKVVSGLRTILENWRIWGSIKDGDVLTEFVRQNLGRAILNQYKAPEGTLPVITIANDIEASMFDSVRKTDHGEYLSMDPALGQMMINKVQALVPVFLQNNYQPVVLVSPGIRAHIKKFLDRFIPNIAVLSYSEITGDIQIRSLGIIKRWCHENC